jgi:hypothetical protein
MSEYKQIKDLWEFVKDDLSLKADKGDIRDLIDQMNEDNDVYWECDSEEYRIIHTDVIDDIAEDEIKEIVQDCYLNGLDMDKLWWIEIDWEQTADNCISADGYGHHFSSYDGSEQEWEDWYFFRVN